MLHDSQPTNVQCWKLILHFRGPLKAAVITNYWENYLFYPGLNTPEPTFISDPSSNRPWHKHRPAYWYSIKILCLVTTKLMMPHAINVDEVDVYHRLTERLKESSTGQQCQGC